ncbi:MAG: hypothetical protein L0191_08500, partial [Acidobacteria bacterium]|nr:hypothetical protein [Acidobacteriota bacterium]
MAAGRAPIKGAAQAENKRAFCGTAEIVDKRRRDMLRALGEHMQDNGYQGDLPIDLPSMLGSGEPRVSAYSGTKGLLL